MQQHKQVTFDIPDGSRRASCKGCGAVIYWIKTASGKSMPVDPDGTSHFATCPNAKTFRREAKAT